MIFPFPIDPMCFKRIATIRDEDHGSSPVPEDADHFTEGEPVILYVFEHFVAEDQVKCRGGQREKFTCSIEDMRRIHTCCGSALKVVFQSDHVSPKRGEVFHVHPDPAAILKDATLDPVFRGTNDHFQPALLPLSPNIGRFTS